MGFGTGKYAKVWSVEKGKGNYYVAEMSSSRKMKDKSGNTVQENGRDKYKTDWTSKFTRLVGTAATQAESLQGGESVKIGACEVTNEYDKEKKVTYTNYTIFAFDEINGSSPKSSKNAEPDSDGFINTPDGEDEELPFA